MESAGLPKPRRPEVPGLTGLTSEGLESRPLLATIPARNADSAPLVNLSAPMGNGGRAARTAHWWKSILLIR